MNSLTQPPEVQPEQSSAMLENETVALPRCASSPQRGGERVAQIIVLIVLFAAPALLCAHTACVFDPDVWWHLRTGEWILQHHGVPYVDSYSNASGQPWAAYSWLFELLVYTLFRGLGLPGIVAFSASMVLAITAALNRLIRRSQSDFSLAVLLTFVITVSLQHLYTPRPWMFTILFFVLELDILMHVRRTGRTRALLWLPLLFALWANLHIQFIDGLLVLGLALAEAVLTRWMTSIRTRLLPAAATAAMLACVLATLLTPYGWRIYKVAYELAAQPGVMDKISELQAIPFRGLPDFVVLFLALACAAMLARARFQFFQTGLLIFAAVASFRSQRDVWVMAATAAAILPAGLSFLASRQEQPRKLPAFAAPIAACIAGLVLFCGFRIMKVNQTNLQIQLASAMPVTAVEVVKQRRLSGPVFNDYGWGGYLIWDLRQRVSIDGRASLQGTERIDRSGETWNAGPDWASDPDLRSAGLVIARNKSPLIQLLKLDPDFQLLFEDKIAAVFVQPRLQSSSVASQVAGYPKTLPKSEPY